MTARANSLTRRAKAAKAPAALPWDMLARDVTVFVTALEQLGYDMATAMAQSPLAGVDLRDPDRRVPCEAAGALIALAQRQRFTPNIAAEIATRTPMGAFPLADYLVMTSETVDAALRQLAAYFHLVGHPARLSVQDDADGWRLTIEGPPFSVEFSSVLAIKHLRTETDGRFSAAGLFLRQTPDDPAAIQALVGCPVHIGEPWSGFTVDREKLRLPLRRRDPVLRRLLEEQANAVLLAGSPRTGIALDVARLLTRKVVGGPIDIDTVARALATSPRTLQRRLTEAGARFQVLVEEARRDASARLLRASSLSIGEIAYLVGYSEPAAFHRAFKRWFDVTPEAFRHQSRPT